MRQQFGKNKEIDQKSKICPGIVRNA